MTGVNDDDDDDQKHADAARWLLCGYQLPVILFLIISDIKIVIIFVITSDIIIPRQPAVWVILLAWTASLVSCPALRLSLPEAQVIITRMGVLGCDPALGDHHYHGDYDGLPKILMTMR